MKGVNDMKLKTMCEMNTRMMFGAVGLTSAEIM